MRASVDSSAWFAASNVKDRHHLRASELLGEDFEFVTSTFVLVETWLLLQSKISFALERLGIAKVISFDADFLIYRFGANRDRAFEVMR